jgi:electron transport complex protein RnfG
MSDGAPTPAAEPSAARLVATLSLAGLLSGVAIAGAYVITQPRIQANKAEALRRAVFNVVPGADSMQTCTLRDGRIVTFDGAQPAPDDAVYATYSEHGDLLGYAIPAEGAGFQDAIRLIFGYEPQEQRIVGMQVLESRETPGLGDKIIKDAHFLENFVALDASSDLVLVKKGAKAHDNEVDAITGATISSRAVVRILNDGLDTWRAPLQRTSTNPEAIP